LTHQILNGVYALSLYALNKKATDKICGLILSVAQPNKDRLGNEVFR